MYVYIIHCTLRSEGNKYIIIIIIINDMCVNKLKVKFNPHRV